MTIFRNLAKTACGLRVILISAVFFALSAHDAAAQSVENLLAPPLAKLEVGLTVGRQATAVPALIDGDPSTLASFSIENAKPINLVFSLGGQVASPESLMLTLAGAETVAPARVDILVSTNSPQAGFRSLRTEVVKPGVTRLEMKFRAAAASWIMLRLYPAPDAGSITLADIRVSGRIGPPETVYSFSETPARAIDILARLADIGSGSFALDDAEREVFAAARKGRLDRVTFEAIALQASGVIEMGDRRRYITALDRLEAGARAAIDLSADPASRGADLLTWLHGEALRGGYRAGQTDLSVLLDSGVFNCVSSAVVYTALGLRLGLDVRAIEVPDHAFAIVYDGTNHMDVETTTARGFNPARERVAKFENLTGFSYIPQSNKAKRREIDEAGLAALIYYNHGVEFARSKRYHAAILANFRAMSLDAEFASAAKNALAALGNWSLELSRNGRWEDALEVAAVATGLAPKDARLASNHITLWKNWALAVADTGQQRAAIDILRDAARALPSGGFESMHAWIYIRPGERHARAGEWNQAFKATEAGLAALAPGPLADLKKWRQSIYLRWVNREIRAGRFGKAVDVLELGLKAQPRDSQLGRTVAYLGQQWARSAGDFDHGIETLAEMRRRFARFSRLRNVTESYVQRYVRNSIGKVPLDQALELIARARPALPERPARGRIGEFIFESYARAAQKQVSWERAAEIYSRGLAAHPKSYRLANNARYVAQEWLQQAITARGASAVPEITGKLTRLFPDRDFSNEAGKREIRREVHKYVGAGRYNEADAFLNSARLSLSNERFAELGVLIIDRRAGTQIKKRAWSTAARIYAKGRRRFPDNWRLDKNIVYLAQEWQRSALTEGGATKVVAVSAQLARLFPLMPKLLESGMTAIRREVSGHVKNRAFDEAEALVEAASGLLSDKDARTLVETLFDGWGRTFMKAGDWKGAAEKYAEGLAAAADSGRLKQNAVYMLQEWARAALAHGSVAYFLATAEEAQQIFPNLPKAGKMFQRAVKRKISKLVKRGDFEGSLSLIAETSTVHSDKKRAELQVYVYDQWARTHMKKNDWEAAIEVYDRGLVAVPSSGRLANNRKYCLSKIH